MFNNMNDIRTSVYFDLFSHLQLKYLMYQVYVLLCADGTLYTGISKDLGVRVVIHNSGRGAKYTRSRLPVKLLYFEELPNKSEALKREIEIKSWPRMEKIRRLGIRTDRHPRYNRQCPS